MPITLLKEESTNATPAGPTLNLAHSTKNPFAPPHIASSKAEIASKPIANVLY
jgi:hypothetical protein